MSEMLRAAIVRVRRESDEQVVGVGFLIDAGKKTILTCAHVVNAAIGDSKNQAKPRSLITLDFPFIDTEKRFDARVTHFFPKKADNTDDIAVLEILDDLPADARAVQLATADTYSSHEFSVYGFPQRFEEDGQYVEGKLQERLVNKRIQAIGTSNLGHFVEEGFSGSPVYDKELKAVVGMMMSIADEREKRVAYICPPDVIAGLYADLPFKKIEPVTEVAKVNMPPTASDKWLQRVDIFISSPSDVAEEREAILRVIERLNRQPHIRNRYLLNPLLYEREVPPEAGDYAQIIVDRYMAVEDSYLLICLMWNRMGTSFTHPQTGEEFQSGTEYEFTIGYRANTQKGRPHLLLYRKTTEQTDIDEAEKEKVDTFFRRFEGKGATFKGLYKPFSALREFEEMLFDHIGLILHDKPPISTRSVAEDSLFTSVNPSRSLSYEQSRLAGTTSKRVFICYSELDGTDLAEFVYEAFYQSGCPAWIDYKHIAEGVDEDEIDEAIDEALANCDSVVILVTPAARKKPASTYWREALRREKHIIPVFFVKPDDAPLQIRHKRGFYVPAFSELTNQLPNIISAVGCSKTESASTLSNLKTIQLEPQEKIFTSASNPPSVVDERSAYEYVLELLGKRAYQEIIDWTNDLSKDVLSAELYSIRAIAYKGLGQSSLIRQELEVAKQLAPHDPERYLESAENHLDVGRVREAFEDFEKALQLDPDLQETVYLETSAVVIFVRHADQLPMPLFDEIEGRSELTFTLRQALGSGQAVLLYGMGGIGKTALATLIAQEYLKDGRNVLWVNVGSARLETLLSTIGQEVERELDEGKTFNEAESTEQKAGYIAKWLQTEKPLLVLDDAWNPEETKQFLMTVIPAQCPIIVTTRRTDFDDIEGVIKIDIPHLTPEAAVNLYQTINDTEDDVEAITALCKMLNYHPLAIRLAALKAKRETQTSAQLLNQIGTGSSKNSIRAIFDAVVGDIGDRATNVFLVIGALPVTRVTDDFMAITLDEAVTEIAGLLRDLASIGLINPTVTPDNEPFYAVHDLTYAYAHDLLVEQNRVDKFEHNVVKAACRYVERFSNNTPDNFRKLAVEKPTLIASITRAKGYQDHASIYALVDGLLTFLDYQGYSVDYLNVLSIASEAAETQQDKRKQARYWNELATIFVKLGRYQQAIQYFELALVVSREFGDQRSEGSMIGNLANVYVSLGELDRAIEYYEIALNIAREIGDRAGEATTLNNLSTVWDSRGDKRKALELYEQALPLIRAIGDRRAEATTLSNIGAVWDALGEKRRALEYYEQALPLSRAIGDRRGEAVGLTNIGVAWDDLGEKQKALECYEQALILHRAVGNVIGEASTLNNIGSVWVTLGEINKALEYYEMALQVSRSLSDQNREASILNSMGSALLQLGDLERARTIFETAISLFEKTDNKFGISNTLRALGDLSLRLGELNTARVYYDRALPLYEGIGDRLGLANIYRALADLSVRSDDLDVARAYYDRALPLYEATGARLGLANTYQALGDLGLRVAELDAARAYYDRALPLYEAVGDRLGLANTYRALADLSVRLAELDVARAYYDHALPLYEAVGDRLGLANTYQALGDLSLRLAELDAARAYYDRALPLYEAIGDRLGLSNTLKALGDLSVRLAELDAARAYYDHALPLYEAIGDRLGLSNTLKALGDLSVRLAELDVARAYYDRALPLFETIGSRLGQANTLKSLGDLSAELNQSDIALAYYNRAEELFKTVGDIVGNANTLISKARLAYQQKDFNNAKAQYEQVFAITENHPGFRDHPVMKSLRIEYERLLKGETQEDRTAEAISQLTALYQQGGADAVRDALKGQVSDEVIEALLGQLSQAEATSVPEQKDEQRSISISGNVQGGNINIGGQQSFAGNINIGGKRDESDAEDDE